MKKSPSPRSTVTIDVPNCPLCDRPMIQQHTNVWFCDRWEYHKPAVAVRLNDKG